MRQTTRPRKTRIVPPVEKPDPRGTTAGAGEPAPYQHKGHNQHKGHRGTGMACRILIVISLMAAALTAHPTRASDRVALVIGNADYAHVPRLANPLNDAGDMGAALARGQIARLTDPEAVETALGLETDDYALVQLALDAAAFRLGRIDGKFGPGSRGALKRWQASKGYPATGFLTGKQLADLREKGRDIEARDREARDKAREARDKARARAEAEGAAKGAARGRILLDRHGTRAMHEAAEEGHVDAMRWLQAQGADVNARDNSGETPMHRAAWNGQVDAMRWLQAQGADVNSRDDYGETPLGAAERLGKTKAVNWLRANGRRK